VRSPKPATISDRWRNRQKGFFHSPKVFSLFLKDSGGSPRSVYVSLDVSTAGRLISNCQDLSSGHLVTSPARAITAINNPFVSLLEFL
jgi:hypothetical protein